MHRRWRIAAAVGTVLALLALPDCRTNEGCDPGQACTCSTGNDCALGCTGDGCNQECDSVGGTTGCGLVCNNGCDQSCHGTSACTSSCGNDCRIECFSTGSCGAICGDHCQFTCHDSPTCAVAAGPGSVVACTSAQLCEADCAGDCHVTCTSVQTCTVRCPQGAAPTQCPDGSLACGPC